MDKLHLELHLLLAVIWCIYLLALTSGSSAQNAEQRSKAERNDGRAPVLKDKPLLELHMMARSKKTQLISCEVVNNKNRTAVAWFRNGSRMHVHPDKRDNRFYTKKNGFALHVHQIKLSDDKSVFGCLLSNPHGQTWKNVTLTVVSDAELYRDHIRPSLVMRRTTLHPPASGRKTAPVASLPDTPHFMDELGNRMTSATWNAVEPKGADVILECPVHGYPEPQIHWLKDKKMIHFDMTHRISFDENYALRIEDIQVDDNGEYECNATNTHGSATLVHSVVVQLQNIGKPMIESDYPKNTSVVIGQSASFECKTHSELHPSIIWIRYHSGTTVVDKLIDAENTELVVSSEKYNLSDAFRLVIHNVTFNDSGIYGCVVENPEGASESRAYLDVKLEPDVVSTPTHSHFILVVVIAVVLGMLFLFAVAFAFYCRCKRAHADRLAQKISHIPISTYRKRIKIIQRQDSAQSDNSIVGRIFVEDDWHAAGASMNNSGSIVTTQATTTSHCNSTIEYLMPNDWDWDWEYPRERLLDFNLEKPIGEGAFGKVIKARAPDIRRNGGEMTVAVKTSKENADESEFIGLVQEFLIMKAVGPHRNIINLLGCCTLGGPFLVLVEYAPYGNLRDFLRQHRNNDGYEQPIGMPRLTQRDLGRFAYEIVGGMEYLSSKRVIHRDLAARNILVGENYVMKIADFGLAKDVYAHDYYRKISSGRLPVKWMALEALIDSLYTYKSDIWSFGVLLWEIMSFGANPYPYMNELEKLVIFLQTGRRMDAPANTPPAYYELMLQCWHKDPNVRPSFSELTEQLNAILTESEYLEISKDEFPMLENNPQYMLTPASTRANVDPNATIKSTLLCQR